VLSSATVWRAHACFLSEKMSRFHGWLVATIGLGSLFLFGQLSEYFRLFEKDITISKNPLSTGFFTVTGFHGLHVCIGVLLLLLLLVWSLIQKRFGKRLPPGSLESISLYWHFVDVVWIGVFSIVYVWGTR
jgi:heme/copper-type cytochrome/quinol oxidase subunit 3